MGADREALGPMIIPAAALALFEVVHEALIGLQASSSPATRSAE
jgi:hypothetical protein